MKAFVTRDEAQALPLVALMLTVLAAMTGLVVDVGRVVVAHNQLQSTTDAAALAGASALPSSNATNVATQYSAVAGDLNASSALPGVSLVPGYPKVVCLTTLTKSGLPCQAPASGNAIVVKQQINVDLSFMKIVGLKTLPLTASSTASMRGAAAAPYNIAIILDATLSMQMVDSNCSGLTQMACALSGIQSFLQALTPCPPSYTTCSISNGVAENPIHQVALFTFPNISIGTAIVDTSCTTAITSAGAKQYGYNYDSSLGYYSMYPQTAWSGIATAGSYSFPAAVASSYAPSGSSNPTYQVTPFVSDYKASYNAASLNNSSVLVKAANAVSGCSGLLTPNWAGSIGTYYAGALYAAQAALAAQQANYPSSQNVIILLSDGDANAPQINGYTQGGKNYYYYVMPPPASNNGNYPSYANECQQGVTAAASATASGTRVYTVAYGSPTASSSCKTDSSNITACGSMSAMASATQYFYSDYNQSGNTGGNCYSSQAVTSLNEIFKQIAGDMTSARLIPDNTT